jgi:hypothetical protein
MRWTGLRVTPVAGSEMTAPKLSTPICIFVTPDIRGISELDAPMNPFLLSNLEREFSPTNVDGLASDLQDVLFLNRLAGTPKFLCCQQSEFLQGCV